MADASEILRALLETVAMEQGYVPADIKVKAESSNGSNFTSALYLATISSPRKDDLELFGKVSIVNKVTRNLMNATWMYQTERYVYNDLMKIYEEFEVSRNISSTHRYIFPKYYGCNANFEEETILLENLVAKGYHTYSRFSSLTWEYAECAVQLLAKFHALSFAYRQELPADFKVEETRQFLLGRQDHSDDSINDWMVRVTAAIEKLKDPEAAIKVGDFFKAHVDKSFLKKFHKPISVSVICHGDFRPSNLLFTRQNDKLQAICVDYQTVHAGCPATDLVYLIFLGTDQEFRRQHYSDLVDLYYSELSAAMRRLDVDPEAEYSREVFDMELKQVLPYALLIGVIFLPVVTVEAENAPRVDRSESTNDFVIPPNELFIERFNGIVDDCISMGVI